MDKLLWLWVFRWFFRYLLTLLLAILNALPQLLGLVLNHLSGLFLRILDQLYPLLLLSLNLPALSSQLFGNLVVHLPLHLALELLPLRLELFMLLVAQMTLQLVQPM